MVTCSGDLGCSIGTRVTRVTRVAQSKTKSALDSALPSPRLGLGQEICDDVEMSRLRLGILLLMVYIMKY